MLQHVGELKQNSQAWPGLHDPAADITTHQHDAAVGDALGGRHLLAGANLVDDDHLEAGPTFGIGQAH